MYAGTGSAGCAEGLVFHLVQELPKYQNHQLYFDNWFSTLPLLLKLKDIGLGEVAATFRVNRIASCPLIADKEYRAKGRGRYNYQTDNNSGLHIVKW